MEELTPLLEKLVEKLGTTAEHLWGVLISQVEVQLQISELWLMVGVIIFGGLTATFIILLIVSIIRDWEPEASFLFGLVAALSGTVGTCITVKAYATVLTLTINPEYWALQQILETIQ